MSTGNDVSAQQSKEGNDTNLLLLRGVDSVARVSNNVILVKTTGEERLTCVDEEGNRTEITVANENEVTIGQGVNTAKQSPGLDSKQEQRGKGSARRTKQKTESRHNIDRSDSPKVSLPPEVQLLAEASSKDEEPNIEIRKFTEALTCLSVENKDDITSLSTNLKEFLPKILKVDIENKRLKETNAQLEEEVCRYKTVLQRSDDARRKADSDTSLTKKEKESHDGDASRRQHEEFIKMKKQLKKALDANQAWNNYCNDQLKVHLRQLHANDEHLRKLQEKLKSSKTEFSESEKQFKINNVELEKQLQEYKDKLVATEGESRNIIVRNQQLEEEQKKVRKLAKGLIKEKEDLQMETDVLKEKVAELSSTNSRGDVIKTTEMSNGTESDRSTNLSHSLRNVERAVGAEHLPQTIESPDSGVSTTENPAGASNFPGTSEETARKSDETANDAISLLREQVQQFKDDFYRERQDRERAFGELDKIKKELENTKLLLHQQSEVSAKKKTKKLLPRFTGKQKREKEKKDDHDANAFRYLDPDEVTHLQGERPATEEIRENTYKEEDEEGNHVYHQIED